MWPDECSKYLTLGYPTAEFYVIIKHFVIFNFLGINQMARTFLKLKECKTRSNCNKPVPLHGASLKINQSPAMITYMYH